MKRSLIVASVLALAASSVHADPPQAAPQKLLHVSFGFTKAFYADYNAWFIEKWRKQTGQTVQIEQSHGPSGTQTEAVIAGKLQPDVVTLASPEDLDQIAARTGALDKDWRSAFPQKSSPYYSAVVFLVRPGNPKGIKDWPDLASADRELVTSDPKACGGGRWNYAAAFGLGAAENAKEDYLAAFVKNTPTFYPNQGAAGEAFLKQNKGDVLITYESFALDLTAKAAAVELVVPARTVEIELPVAIARKYTEANKTTKLARAYLQALYDPEVQALFAKHHFRPRLPAAWAKAAGAFPKLELVKAERIFGARAAHAHLAEGGVLDSLAQKSGAR